MSEDEKQESQKTVVAFIAGLLIGGLLVWVFGGTPDQEVADDHSDTETTSTVNDDEESPSEGTTADNTPAVSTTTEAPAVSELPMGDADVTVKNQSAGTSVALDGATFPSDEGWIGVRDYVNGQLTGLLGVARYSKEQGLVPEAITLQRATVAGNTYAIVFYSESGDRVFNIGDDIQMGGVSGTFVAQ